METMNNNEEAKANLWGSLAAELEMQCGDVLSLDDNSIHHLEEEEDEPLPLCRRLSSNGGGAAAAAPPSQGSNIMNGNNNNPASAPIAAHAASTDNNNPSDWKASAIDSSNSNSLNQFQSTQLFAQSQQQHSLPQQQQQQQHMNLHHPYPNNIVMLRPTFSSSSTKTSILKDWIVTKKIHREIKEATYNGTDGSSNEAGRMSKFQKEYIVKCVKAAHLLVGKLEQVETTTTTNNTKKQQQGGTTGAATANSSRTTNEELFIPTPRDIDQDGISIIENVQSGEVVDVEFNVYRSSTFNWDVHGHGGDAATNNKKSNSSSTTTSTTSNDNGKLGSMLGALGKLFYILFTEGESVPIVDVDDYTPVSTKTTSSRKRKVKSSSSSSRGESSSSHKHNSKDSKAKKKSREEDAIMDILLNFAMPGDTDREDDYIIESMRKGNLPLHLCRFVSDLLYSSRVLEKDDGGFGDGNGGSSNPHHHQDSIFTSIADVHSDLKQMIDFPDAFLYGTVNSRWEIVFGSNHVFGREKEMQLLMTAVRRIESLTNDDKSNQQQHPNHPPPQQQRMKEVVIISGRAGTGKSLLVQEMRKPLQAQGWIFLRCKFEKKIGDPEPLSVIALGFDEFFASCISLCSNDVTAVKNAPPGTQSCCPDGCCSRNICHKLEGLIGWIGLTTLSRLMPSLRRILKDVYPSRNFNGEEGLDTNNVRGPNGEHLFVTLLDVLSQLRPVLFFTDDLQFAGDASLALLNDMVNKVGTTVGETRSSLLVVGAHRTVDTESNPLLLKMLTQYEASDIISTTQIDLCGFELESLNEMVSDALCLPRRKTRSLAEVVHQKTLGIPLFVVEFLDALLTEKLLVHNSATGWGWDVDSIDLKKISSGVAALLACKLEQLPSQVLSAVKILSVLGSHIDRGVLEVVKKYDGSDGSTLIPSLYTAQREGLLDIAGPTFTFMHETIKLAAFNLIQVADRIPMMLRIVACLLPHCKQHEKETDAYLFTTVDIINIIGSQAVSKNLGQSRVFAQLNLNAGKKSTNFRTALDYFEAGISFLQGDYWNDQYELTLSLFEAAATANYSGGRHDQVAIQTNKIFSMARSFEDKFKSYCLYINVLAIGNTEKAMEQLYHLLKSLGEDINPNTINAPMAMVDFSSLKQMLGGARKDVLLQLPPMTDRNKLMAMKLMAMLVLYYNQQLTHLSGYFSCKMIRMSIQHGHCEDTVFALSVFACATMNFLGDTNEAASLAKCALSMSRLYNSEQLIPRIYSRIYGGVLCFTQPMATSLPPMLKACRIAFARGTSEQSIFNTMIYVARSLQSGKKIPLLLDEVKAFALKHNQLNHMGILQLFLAPVYKFLSSLSGITFDPSTLLPQLAVAPIHDVVQTALAKKETVYVRLAVVLGLGESLFLRDFANAYKIMTRYPKLFLMLDDRQQLRITEFEVTFIGGLLSFYWARETREPQWIQRGMNALAAFEDWSKLSPWDSLHRYHLLKAELHHSQGDTIRAIESFDAAIANTKKHHHSHHEAIACEWAAHFYDSIGNNDKTKEMIQKSHDAYIKWGAVKKAEALIKLLQVVPSVIPSTMQNQNQPSMSFL